MKNVGTMLPLEDVPGDLEHARGALQPGLAPSCQPLLHEPLP
jgi:hypothetical protein